MKRTLYSLIIMVAFHLFGTTYGQETRSTLDDDDDPTATITGSDTDVCLGDSVSATLTFTGRGPWTVVINNNSGVYLTLYRVKSPYTIWLKPETDDRYYISSVRDRRYNSGNTYGEVEVFVLPAIPVSILLDKTAYLYSDSGVNMAATPSGGVFSGPGIADNVFYPGVATPQGSPHHIIYSYTNPDGGCISTDNIDIHVLYGEGEVHLFSGDEIINSLCDNEETYVIRGSNLDHIPGWFELREAGSPDPVPGHISDKDLRDDEAILDPAGLTGLYDIIYTYEFQSITVSMSHRFQVSDLGFNGMTGLPEVVCKNDDPYHLMPDLVEIDPGAVYLFSGPGVSGNQAEGYYYDPGDPDAHEGENQITLNYTSSNGCSSTLARIVTNAFVPDVQFTLAPVCLPGDGGMVTFKNVTSGKNAVDSWSWDFGDPSSGANNISSLENPEHFYKQVGFRQITLTATTSEGCDAFLTVDTILTDSPVADFSWISDCFVENQQIAFVDRSISTFSMLDTFVWVIKSTNDEVLGAIGSGSPADTVEFLFPGMDNYLIDLHIRNEVGCEGSASKEIILKPITILTANGYEEDFNGEKTDWISNSDGQYLSWVWDVPDFTDFTQVTGDRAWFTKLPPDNPGYFEHSWIRSSCFDFSSMRNPVIKMDLMKSLSPGVDGAVLQYQDVVSEGWKTIGNVGEGINWYNATDLFHKPGGSSIGWGLDLFTPDHRWVNATHGLDMVAGHPHVKFRVVIATGGQGEIEPGRYNQGLALDNIFIGEHIRKSLLEYFTNSASKECRDADVVVDQFALNHPESVIDLQYHMDYPGVDPMNINNPYPSSTRAFNYGIQGVPNALLNGEILLDFSDPFNEPNSDILKHASLEIPQFDLDLGVDWQENSLEATALITCRSDTFSSNLQLYVVLIESLVTTYPGLNQDTMFRNVVLDMLPSPAGKLLGNAWFNGKSDSRSFTWDYAEYVEDIEDLAVVAFVLDRDNGQVLQVASDYLTTRVGTADRFKDTRSLTVYPNPARDNLFANFGSEVTSEGMLKIVDLSGREVMQTDVRPGYSIQHLDISRVSKGLYMIYWMESGEIKGRNKVIVTH